MPDDYKQLVSPEFDFLIDECGFRIIGGGVSGSFDNMYVFLTNDSLNVLIAREAGFLDAEVSSPAASELGLPLRYLRQFALHRDPGEVVTFTDQADFLRSYLAMITDLVSEAHLMSSHAGVIEVGRERRKKLFPGSVSEP